MRQNEINFLLQVNVTYRNETLFPDERVEDARNYCRDPSRNIAGSWCYTMDPKVPQDVCDVRDCVKPGMTNFHK